MITEITVTVQATMKLLRMASRNCPSASSLPKVVEGEGLGPQRGHPIDIAWQLQRGDDHPVDREQHQDDGDDQRGIAEHACGEEAAACGGPGIGRCGAGDFGEAAHYSSLRIISEVANSTRMASTGSM
jgi:hypothetical protein